MRRLFRRAPRPAHPAEEAALRASFNLPRLGNPEPDRVRLNRIADGALRAARRGSAPPASAFGFLASPRLAGALLAVAILGFGAGAFWPRAASASHAGIAGWLDLPLSTAIGDAR